MSTVTVYIKATSSSLWSPYPTATELYLNCRYISDDAVGACVGTEVQSTQVLSDSTTWVAFTCTFSPHISGLVDCNIVLGKYQDSSTGIYIDCLPIVS